MTGIERKGAEVIRHEDQQKRGWAYRMSRDPGRKEGAIDMEKDPETGEWVPKDPSAWDWFAGWFEQKGEEIEREEAEQEKGLTRWEPKRERKVASGVLTSAGLVGGTIGAGALWTTGKILKYGLIGFSFSDLRKDTATLKAFDDTYKAAKGGGFIAGLTEALDLDVAA